MKEDWTYKYFEVLRDIKERYKNDVKYRKQLRLNGVKSQLSQNRKTPETEILIEQELNRLKVDYTHHFIIEYYEFDFFIPLKNILIEVQGDYWHGNPLFYEEKDLLEHQKGKKIRDIQKKTFAENRGYKVLEIWENDIKKNNFSSIKEIFNVK